MSGASFTVVTQSVVSVFVSSSINSFETERRFQKDLTIANLKGKLELLTGATAGNMRLELYSKDKQVVCRMDNDEVMLGSYPIDDGMRIHVVDNSVKVGEFEDVSQVQKFELTDEQYSKRADSVKAFKERNKMGRFADKDPEQEKRLAEKDAAKLEAEKQMIETMKIGDRCEVTRAGQGAKRGTVRYIGLTDFQPGYWVGVQYNEPVGKNDGCVKGRSYFKCPMKYGGFVKPEHISVGDYPEEDLGFSDDDEM